MRRNPSGGFLPALGGFLAVPIATHFAAAFSARVVPASGGAVGVNNRAQVFDVATAILSWAGRDRVHDAGWRAFVTGGMWGSIVSAVLRPVVYGMMAARGELGPGASLPVVYPTDYSDPPPRPALPTPTYQEADSAPDYAPDVMPPLPGHEEDDGFDLHDALDILPSFGPF